MYLQFSCCQVEMIKHTPQHALISIAKGGESIKLSLMSSASWIRKIYYPLCENKDSSCVSALGLATSHLVSVTFWRLYLQASGAVNSQSKISRCQPRTWLNGGWVRAAGAGGLVHGRRHISVRLSCSGSLLKFQCQDPAWLTNKGQLCVWGQGDRQASEPVKWQEMAWGPVTPLQEQTQHYLTVHLWRRVGSFFWASMYTEIVSRVNTTTCTIVFFPSICLHVWTHLSRQRKMSEYVQVLYMWCVSLWEYNMQIWTHSLSLSYPFHLHLFICLPGLECGPVWVLSPLHLSLSSLHLSICWAWLLE